MAPCENNYSLAKNCDERKIFVNKVLMLYPGQILQQKLKKKWTAILPAIVSETLSLNGYAFIQFKFSINWLPSLLLPVFFSLSLFFSFYRALKYPPHLPFICFCEIFFFLLNAPNCRKGNQKSWKFSEKATSIKTHFHQSDWNSVQFMV